MPSIICDGMDVLAVKKAVKEAVDRARTESTPTLIECKTYRWYGHSSSDQRAYRTREEEAEWKERDPITVLRKKLAENSIATEEEMDAVDAMAAKTIECAARLSGCLLYTSRCV